MRATVQGTNSIAQWRQVYNMLDDMSHLIYNGKQ